MIKPIDLSKLIANIHKNVRSKSWKCIADNCDMQSINSHLLQQNGILDNVTFNGHVVECSPTDMFSWIKGAAPFNMKLRGKKEAFSIPLFCSHHDTVIFKEIETHPISLSSYRVQLLLSYRVVCAELRKKERAIELYNRILNAETLKTEGPFDEIESYLEGNRLGIIDLKNIKVLFEEELKENQLNFIFKFYLYPFLGVYASAVFSPIDYSKVHPNQESLFNQVYIHIIPYEDHLNIIVGYHKDYVDDWIKEYVESWADLNKEEIEKKLTHLFTAHIENWGISPKLFKVIKKDNIERLIKYLSTNLDNLSQNQETSFNLFEL
jgi:hypothetical protein